MSNFSVRITQNPAQNKYFNLQKHIPCGHLLFNINIFAILSNTCEKKLVAKITICPKLFQSQKRAL